MSKRNRARFLVKKGRMTQGEKDALANFYLAFYAPRSVRRGATRDMIDEQYPYDLDDVERLIVRGLMDSTGGMSITPQGEAVAKMILGLTGQKRGRRRNAAGDWYAYEVGMTSQAYGGKIIGGLGTISGPPGVPFSQLKQEAHREFDIPVKRVRLRAMLVPGARWA